MIGSRRIKALREDAELAYLNGRNAPSGIGLLAAGN